MDHPLSDTPLTPVRALVAAVNRQGQAVPVADLERWLRLVRTAYRAQKADILARQVDVELLPSLIDFASTLDLRLSLRTNEPPPETPLPQGLLDVHAVVRGTDTERIHAWVERCSADGLPLRLTVLPPLFDGMADWANEDTLCAVTLALADPLGPEVPPAEAEGALAPMQALAKILTANGIDVTLLGPPYCRVEPGLRSFVRHTRGFHRDHLHYEQHAWDLAQTLYAMGLYRLQLTLLMLLGRHTAFPNPIDDKLLPWIIDRPWLRARIWAWHKLTRPFRLFRGRPAVIEETAEAYEAETARRQQAALDALPEPCRTCGYRRICDQGAGPFCPGLDPGTFSPIETDEQLDPAPMALQRPRYYDPIDAARQAESDDQAELAEAAIHLTTTRPPDREIDSFEYGIEGQWAWQLAGTVRWFSWTNTEKTSTPLGVFERPLTLSTTFGGGVAEYIGYAVGRYGRILCPMTAYSHRLVLHVAADGRYVLLRDGAPVRPVTFAGEYYVPTRLPARIEPRIAIWNIDGVIGTQGVTIWQSEAAPVDKAAPTWSVVIVCTRYARRLQATLLNLAHQQDVPTGAIEVIVAYVPGIDATGDVLDTIEAAYPHLRIVRNPYTVQHATSKGFLINESVRLAQGKWVVLLDADILLAPETFARMASVPESASFVVPDGRKMLPPEVTSRILLGTIAPWEAWDGLLAGPGEYRRLEADGVPVGYCQIVRRSCFDTVRYEEMNHFEGADWRFAVDMREAFGREHRLSGAPVLHLDHGGSQWYGAPQHR